MKIIKPNALTLTSCSVSESDSVDGVAWASGTTYSQGTLVRYQHVTYKSLKNSNTGHIPPDNISGDDPWWQKIIATMPYRMLDDYTETQTVAAVGANLTFSVPFARADSFALLNLQGMKVAITITESGGDVIFQETVYMQEDISGLSLYAYYFEPIVDGDTYINTNVPLGFNATMSVTIYPAGETDYAKLGHIIIGRQVEIGATKYGTELALTDYSKKIVDDFGYATLIRRSYSKNATMSLFVQPSRVNYVTSLLADLRATPILVEGSNTDIGYEALTIFGWLEDWRTVYQGPNENELSIEVQGLV